MTVSGDRDFLLELSRRVDTQYAELRDEVREIKTILSDDLHELKAKQAEHEKNWGSMKTLVGWIIAPVSGTALFAWIAERLHLLPKS